MYNALIKNSSYQRGSSAEGESRAMGVASKRAEGSLLISTAVTLHDWDNNLLIFQETPLVRELKKLDYPISAINSMLKCGGDNRLCLVKCGCGQKLKYAPYRCNQRTCKFCSQKRGKEIKKKWLPFLYSQKRDRTYQFSFMTISPENYDYEDLDFGIKETKKLFNKWKRHCYLKERIHGGFYVIEAVHNWKGKAQLDKQGNFMYHHEKDSWNIHLHVLLYSRRLDNKTRGHCLDCGQNQMGYDKEKKEFYCSNKKCLSRNVIVKTQPKLNAMWEESTGKKAHFYIKRIDSVKAVMNYVLGYVTINKSNFRDEKGLSLYMKATYKKRLISPFGIFTKAKIQNPSRNIICKKCGLEKEFIFDDGEISKFLYSSRPKPPPEHPVAIELENIIEKEAEWKKLMSKIQARRG